MNNELIREYEDLKKEAITAMFMALANSGADMSDPQVIKGIDMLYKCLEFSDHIFRKQIDMMDKIDKIYKELECTTDDLG